MRSVDGKKCFVVHVSYLYMVPTLSLLQSESEYSPMVAHRDPIGHNQKSLFAVYSMFSILRWSGY